MIENALAFLAGYNIRLVLIVQGLGQLEELYGKGAESLLQNTAVQVYFAPNDDTTAMYVSKRLGTKTIAVRSKSEPGGFALTTKSTASAARAFMLPEEVRQLRSTKEIVFKENARPVQAQKIVYYRDKAFTSRLLPALAVPELSLAPMQPRVFELPKKQRRQHLGDTVPEGKEYEAALEGIDAGTEGLVTMSEELARQLEKDSEGSAGQLKAALDDLDSPPGPGRMDAERPQIYGVRTHPFSNALPAYKGAVPIGKWRGRLDYVAWGPAQNLFCYFTDLDTGNQCRLSVFAQQDYKPYIGDICFDRSPAGSVFNITIKKSKDGQPKFMNAQKCSA